MAGAVEEASERVLVVDGQSAARRLFAQMAGAAAYDYALVICDLPMRISLATWPTT